MKKPKSASGGSPNSEAFSRRMPCACGEPFHRAPGLVVEVHKPERTQAFDFRSSTEYILVVRITNNSYARLKMKTLEGDPLWEDENFTWLAALSHPHRDSAPTPAWLADRSAPATPPPLAAASCPPLPAP